ncbi:hypothetical protein GIB67_032006 [Kingdonia uniflora]|uniref:Pre-PUA domain-containing protein n=1 Tax=Kingdonia uniflora TaxID=39325 RepID=A0A7J7MWE7_9MAGN|nr:hypothetical protein GIB67_032006 [Kingdonia uniflora]
MLFYSEVTIKKMDANWVHWIMHKNHLNLALVNNVPFFFNIRDGPYMPTLRLLHQCKAIIAEGKQHALSIGFRKMSVKDM